MKKCLFLIPCTILLMVLLSNCTPYPSIYRPVNYPNTRWVSMNPDIFFEIGEDKLSNGRAKYSQITVNGEVVELMCSFGQFGSHVTFSDPVGFDPETGLILHGFLTNDVTLLRGLCKFEPDRLVVTIEKNDKGILDNSITEIVFIREDINK